MFLYVFLKVCNLTSYKIVDFFLKKSCLEIWFVCETGCTFALAFGNEKLNGGEEEAFFEKMTY